MKVLCASAKSFIVCNEDSISKYPLLFQRAFKLGEAGTVPSLDFVR